MSSYIIDGALTIRGTASTSGSVSLSDGTNTITLTIPTSLSGNYSLTFPSTTGSSGQTLAVSSAGLLGWTSLPPVGLGRMWVFSEQQPAGTGGGIAVPDTWFTRTLNTTEASPSTGASDVTLSGNILTFAVGKYYVQGSTC